MMQRIAAALLAFALGNALAQTPLTEAEVRRVDQAHGKITLKHGEIKNLDMPPMTMVFTAKDKSLLKHVKAGDRVRFAAAQDKAGEYILTAIEPAK